MEDKRHPGSNATTEQPRPDRVTEGEFSKRGSLQFPVPVAEASPAEVSPTAPPQALLEAATPADSE